MLPFALQVILLLLLLGAAIAYIGNYVGRVIGKRRLTLFNLRPRYTSTIITVISGILIALTTVAALLLISQDARTALLGLEQLKREISQKSHQLAEANRALEEKLKQQRELEKTLKKLSREIEISRQGQVIFKVGDTITVSLIQAGPEKPKLEAGLKQILSAADTYIRSLGVKSKKHLIYLPPEEFDQTVNDLLVGNKSYIIKLISTRNALWGEEIPARFEAAENNLIDKAGEAIASRDIPPGLSAPAIEQEILKLLNLSHQTGRDAGVLPDLSGSMGSIPYSQIVDLAKKVKLYKKVVQLKALARKDIYTIGPLEIEFVINNQ